jgi:hypothetical protein
MPKAHANTVATTPTMLPYRDDGAAQSGNSVRPLPGEANGR